MTSGVVVWEVITNPKQGLCHFSLSQGDNPAVVEGLSKVVAPTNQTTFNLSRGRKYEVTVWPEGRNSCGATSQSFEFGGQD